MAASHTGPSELVAPPSWRCIDFISDLHLAEDTPLGFAAWRDYLATTTADAVFILGDLFEAWIGDDARHHGFEAEATAVLRGAATLRPLAVMVGNRDFLLGAEMLDEVGAIALHDPTVLTAFGERAVLSHGDAWCLDDAAYQQWRREVRNPDWQARFAALPLAERREFARKARAQSERHGRTDPQSRCDVDRPTALRHLTDADASTLVHGHTHRPASEALAPGFVRHVLSDWDLDHGHMRRAEVLRWTPGRWARLMPADASA